ncbi:unnamed protein product, partial [Prorocentrum cordatum]
MASFQKILSEINGATNFVTMRSSIAGDAADIEKVKLSLASSLSSMVSSVAWQMDSASATQLMHAVQSSCFDNAQKKLIADAIQAKLLGSSPSSGLGAHEKQSWVVANAVLKYSTARDWVVIGDTHMSFNSDVKASVILSRFGRAGLVKPNEPACKQIVTMLAAATWAHNRPTCKELYDHVQNLAKCFKKLPNPPLDLPVIRKWPESPSELPEEVYKALYPDETDPPIVMALDSFSTVMNEVSCRHSNKKAMQLGMVGAGVGIDGQCQLGSADALGKVTVGSWQPQRSPLMLENGTPSIDPSSSAQGSAVSASLNAIAKAPPSQPLADSEPQRVATAALEIPTDTDFAAALASEVPSKRTAGVTEEEAKATISKMQEEQAMIVAKAKKKYLPDEEEEEHAEHATEAPTVTPKGKNRKAMPAKGSGMK